MHFDFKKALHGNRTAFTVEGSSHEFMHPMRDWMLILGFSVFVLVSGITYSSFDFYTQFVMPESETLVAEKHIRYRDKEIVSMSEAYTEKETVFNTLRAQMPSVPEPLVVPATTSPDTVREEATPPCRGGGSSVH
jgi:hypothetical protein